MYVYDYVGAGCAYNITQRYIKLFLPTSDPLEVVGRYRDPQLQVDLMWVKITHICLPSMCKSRCLNTHYYQ